MRVCSIQHAAWSTHKRVGSLPWQGLQRTPPEFGAEFCYLAVMDGELTPHQRWWYESADVHHHAKVDVTTWAPQKHIILCVTRGPGPASGETQCCLQWITLPNRT